MDLPNEMDCGFCVYIAKLEERKTSVTYKGIELEVTTYFYKCPECGEEFTTNEADELSLNNVHIAYNLTNKS